MDVNAIATTASALMVRVGLQILGAAVIWFVGRRLIALALRLIGRALEHQRFDPTLAILLNVAYWQVYFDTKRAIQECFGEAGYPIPAELRVFRQTT